MVLQLIRTVVQYVGRHDIRMQAPTDAGEAGPGHFFDQYRTVTEVCPHTTVLFRQAGAQEAQFTGLVPELAADLTVLFPLIVVRGGFLLQEFANGIAERSEERRVGKEE